MNQKGLLEAGQIIENRSFWLASGSANAIVTNIDSALTNYSTGMVVNIKSAYTNNGQATINVNGFGAKSITKYPSIPLGSGDIQAGQICKMVYDGTGFQLINPIQQPQIFTRGGTIYLPTGIENKTTYYTIWRAPFYCNATRIYGYAENGTGVIVNARMNRTGLLYQSTNLHLINTGVFIGANVTQNSGFYNGDILEIGILTVSGLTTEIAIQVDFEKARFV